MARECLPTFIAGQWSSDNDDDLIGDLRFACKVHRQVLVRKMGRCKRMAALYVVQICRRMRPQRQAVGQ